MSDILFDFISRYIALTEEEKQAIVSLDIFHSVKKGTVLLAQGKRSQDGYFVLQGCLRSYYVVDGEEKTTRFYTEMETVLPPCIPSKAPSEYSIATVEDSIVTISSPDMETEIFTRFPKFETLCRLLSEDLLGKERMDFDAFRLSTPEQRYLNLQEQRPDLLQRVPQHQLASYLGITPPSLSRLKSRLLKSKK